MFNLEMKKAFYKPASNFKLLIKKLPVRFRNHSYQKYTTGYKVIQNYRMNKNEKRPVSRKI